MKAAYRVTLRSIGTFDDVNVILVNYLLLPLVSLIMFLLIAFGASQDYSRILVGSVITTGIGIVVASTVYDQNINLLDDIFSIRPTFKNYWLVKFVIAALVLSLETIFLGVIGLLVLNKVNIIPRLFLALPFEIFISVLLAYFCAVWGMKKENPYWLSNIVTGSLIILAGMIIPVSEYPTWLKFFAELLPISNLIDWIVNSNIFSQRMLILLIKILVWYLICILSTKIIHSKLLEK
ncbi:ABC transporter permease [Lactobacillus taiwanensis]|uniref:ABC transporter permease n=1 Tax=Lactobacillus taiwanensis TaxID=508451 RepID=UPI002432D868|nr:ABC transporter permease [Lactobacillus taiwanensis]